MNSILEYKDTIVHKLYEILLGFTMIHEYMANTIHT